MLSDAPQTLVKSLRTLVQISEEESVSLEMTRKRTAKIEQAFQQGMQSRIDGRAASIDRSFLSSGLDDFARTQERQRLSEELFLDAERSLMQIYATPALRADADIVSDLLRQWRIVRFEDDPNEFASEMPDPTQLDMSGSTPERLTSSLGFMDHIGDAVRRRQAKFDEQIARSDSLLAQALAASGLLLSKANSLGG